MSFVYNSDNDADAVLVHIINSHIITCSVVVVVVVVIIVCVVCLYFPATPLQERQVWTDWPLLWEGRQFSPSSSPTFPP